MKIVRLDKVDRILEEPYITWIRSQNLILERPVDVIAKIWSGDYKVLVAMDDNAKPAGMIVLSIKEGVCVTVLVHAKNKLLELRNEFYAILKGWGCTRVCTYSHERSKAYERLTGMRHVYSMYEKEL